ncbi:MAG: OB-fold nucleic acid binding domain-containing protein, partial [Solirubrobacterales bacterium]
AWAGACKRLGGRDDLRRREDLWRLGVAGGARRGAQAQLSLPLSIPAAPSLRELEPWQRLVADYASTGIAIAEHPMSLLRPGLDERMSSSADLEQTSDGGRVQVAGMVVARQRPATAKGVVFMLLEDELGTINVVVPPPVYERHRLVVRTASFAAVSGRLERRERVVNVVAMSLRSLITPDQPHAEVRHIEPSIERETGRAEADLAAVMPAAHSFGRRGR